jgi:hypothetical protein
MLYHKVRLIHVFLIHLTYFIHFPYLQYQDQLNRITNPVTQLSSMLLSAPLGPPGQPVPGGMVERSPLGPHQRIPNGGPPYPSSTIAPSLQSQGNPQQPLADPDTRPSLVKHVRLMPP